MTQARPGVTNAHVRKLNRSAILWALRDRGTATLSALASVTGMSRPTALTALEMLIEQGLAEEVAAASGLQGRPARRYRFVPNAGHVLGIAIRQGRTSVLATDLAGTIVARASTDLAPDAPADERLEETRRAAVDCADQVGAIWAAGVAVAGIVDAAGTVTKASTLPGWDGLGIGGTVGEWFRCPVRAANDAGAAALGERWKGSAAGADDLVVLLTGTPIGQGFLLGGSVYEGRSGAAGELGRIQHRYQWDPSALLAEGGATFEELLERSDGGDDDACGQLKEVADRTAEVAAVLVSVLDPALVVIAGDYAVGGERFRSLVERQLADKVASPPELANSTLGDDVVPMGAARLAMDLVELADMDRDGLAGASGAQD